jgi:hypothetical protein
VLAAISLPPVTAEANRHAPSRPHPGRLAVAANTAPISVSANRPAPAAGVTACPPSPTAAAAANATPQLRGAGPEPADPAAGGRIRHPRPLRRRADPALPADRHLPAAEPMVSAASSRQAGVNAGSGGWLTRTGRTAAGARRSSSTGPPPGPDAGTRPEHQRPGT